MEAFEKCNWNPPCLILTSTLGPYTHKMRLLHAAFYTVAEDISLAMALKTTREKERVT